MKKYAKIINETTKEYYVGNQIEAESLGYPLVDLELSYDGRWFEIGFTPEQSIEEFNKEQKDKRNRAYITSTDNLTLRKMRKQALNEWTEEDEIQYIEQITEISNQIEQEFPYKEEETDNYVTIL